MAACRYWVGIYKCHGFINVKPFARLYEKHEK